MRPKKCATTIKDVAREAGVSVSTVSRVLNAKDDVSFETNQKVQDVVDRLGYSSSLAARGLRSHETHMIGLIMPDVATPYCVKIMAGVNRGIAQLDYDLIIFTNGDSRKYEQIGRARRYVSLLNGTIADGVIVVAPHGVDFSTNAPLVVIDPYGEIANYPSINATNRTGVMAGMRYLLGLGHRRIGFITGRLELLSAERRLLGYKDALREAGIPIAEELIQIGDYTTEIAVPAVRTLLSLQNRPTAICASNDMSAIAVYQVAREMNLSIPEDISVIGFDNIPMSAYLDPPLTTVDQFMADMGTLAVEMVVDLIQGKPVTTQIQKFPTQLVIRGSCAPPKWIKLDGTSVTLSEITG
jgi:LacI family transcriptional regulator